MALSNLLAPFLAAGAIAAALPHVAAAQATTQPAQQRSADAPLKVGDEAPLFTLKSLDGKEEFTLADHRGTRPVIIFFGSYT